MTPRKDGEPRRQAHETEPRQVNRFRRFDTAGGDMDTNTTPRQADQ